MSDVTSCTNQFMTFSAVTAFILFSLTRWQFPVALSLLRQSALTQSASHVVPALLSAPLAGAVADVIAVQRASLQSAPLPLNPALTTHAVQIL